MELQLRGALGIQADQLAYIRKQADAATTGRETQRDDAKKYLQPWFGWFNIAGGADEERVSAVKAKVESESRLLLDHIRSHPGTTARSLREFEEKLGSEL